VSALVDKHPDYANVTIMKVDWDRYARSPITRELNVPRRSTLIAFNGGKEQGRVIASASESSLDALFKAVL
jgi:thioredoxin 1